MWAELEAEKTLKSGRYFKWLFARRKEVMPIHCKLADVLLLFTRAVVHIHRSTIAAST